MKYKVTTSYLIMGGDMSHDDEWVFDTREEAQEFVDRFREAFPEETRTMDDPYIYRSKWQPEIEETDDTRADPYVWLKQQIKEKEKRDSRHY